MATCDTTSDKITTEEIRSLTVSMEPKLPRKSELLTTIDVQPPAEVTITNAQISLVPLTILGKIVPIGRAVAFSAQSATPGTYIIEILCDTDAGQKIEGKITIIVEASTR